VDHMRRTPAASWERATLVGSAMTVSLSAEGDEAARYAAGSDGDLWDCDATAALTAHLYAAAPEKAVATSWDDDGRVALGTAVPSLSPAPTAVPVPAPTPSQRCAAIPDWGVDCDWVIRAGYTGTEDGCDLVEEWTFPGACWGCDCALWNGVHCWDSTSFRASGKEKNTCDWIAKQPEKRCGKKDEAGAVALDECPVACGSCPACNDDADWRLNNGKDCAFVAENPERRCDRKGADGRRASEACPGACGTCDETRAPTAFSTPKPSTCPASTSWHFAGNPQRDCAYVGKRPETRCRKKDEAGVRAEDACFDACETCDRYVDPSCVDSTSFRANGKEKNTCDWIAREPEKRCGKKGEGDEIADVACPRACGWCA